LTSRDVVVRRAAARALARIADDPAQKPLTKLLADEDPDVVAWAAYGLGYTCKGREAATVKSLVIRAASLSADPPKISGPLDPFASIADALSRCGNAEAEATLRAWLEIDERDEGAALALGRLASRKKRLEDASVIALLDAGSRPDKPVASALFAFTRLSALPEPIQTRLLDVAGDALEAPAGDRRSYAVRSLGRAGPKATEPLAKVLSSDAFSAAERADAAREIAKLGEPGQVALRR